MIALTDGTVVVHQGDVRECLRDLDAESVQCVVTSPPYWGLRDYGVTGQLGLEATPDEYVANMVAVFREVRRVLRKDGTLWLNLGDAYAHASSGGGGAVDVRTDGRRTIPGDQVRGRMGGANTTAPGLKPKDLVGIPWRVAFALQADGWVLRSDIVWAKPNPMPESVTDRPTKAHEMLFLFSKARRIGPEPTRYDDIPEGEARWLAALLDAEGSLVLRREAPRAGDYGAHSAQVSIGNTSRKLLERVAAVVGEGTVLERSGGTNAQFYHWQLSGKMAAGLLRRVYPFLVVKQRQARCLLALELGKFYRGGHERLSADVIAGRERLWEAVKALNHFGDPDISWVSEPEFGRWDSQRYYYDADAIREPSLRAGAIPGGDDDRGAGVFGVSPHGAFNGPVPMARNARTVWTIATQPYPDAHFATYPEDLVIPCIKAGTKEGDVVLDPFAGSGTTLAVARRLGRRAVGIELNPEYVALIEKRVGASALPLLEMTS